MNGQPCFCNALAMLIKTKQNKTKQKKKKKLKGGKEGRVVKEEVQLSPLPTPLHDIPLKIPQNYSKHKLAGTLYLMSFKHIIHACLIDYSKTIHIFYGNISLTTNLQCTMTGA